MWVNSWTMLLEKFPHTTMWIWWSQSNSCLSRNSICISNQNSNVWRLIFISHSIFPWLSLLCSWLQLVRVVSETGQNTLKWGWWHVHDAWPARRLPWGDNTVGDPLDLRTNSVLADMMWVNCWMICFINGSFPKQQCGLGEWKANSETQKLKF